MAKCLLAWELGAGTGHCAKLRPIAAGLLQRGHKVFVASRDLVTMARLLGPLDVVYLQAPFLLPRPSNPVQIPRTFAHILQNVGFGDSQQLDPLVAAWRNLLELLSPDLVICEHAPTALLATRFCDVRRVVVGTGFTIPPDTWPPIDMRPWLPPQPKLLEADELAIVERINRLLLADKRPTIEYLGQLYSQVDASFVTTFPELDHHGERQGISYFGVWSPPGGIRGEWADAPGPKLFAYLKPPSPTWNLESLLTILREYHVNSLLYLPGVDARWMRQFNAPHIRYSTQRFDIRHVGRNCDLAVLHGTAGTATELLLHGVPQLNIPLFLEQNILSQRVVKLGAGVMAEPNQPAAISSELRALLGTQSYRDGARAFAKRHAAFDVAASIEQVVCVIDGLFS